MNRTLTLFALLLVTAGCKPVLTEIEYVLPAPGTLVEVTNPTIEVGFDHRMNESTIDSTSFIVNGSESGVQEGIFAFFNDSRIATFTGLGEFLPGEVVTIRLTDAIESQSEKNLNSFVWSFSLEEGEAPTQSPFHVEAMTPSIETVSSPRNTQLSPRFNNPYNPFSVTESAVRVVGERSGTREISFQNLLTGFDQLDIAVDRPFIAGERVSLSLTGPISGIDGTVLPTSLLGVTTANLGSLWPEDPLDSGSDLGSDGLLFFLDPDADGIEEWLRISADGAVTLQDADPNGATGFMTWSLPGSIIDAAIGDFDGDGRIDLACLDGSGDQIHLLWGSRSIAVLMEGPETIALTRSADGVTSGHADADGITDLILWGVEGIAVAHGDEVSPFANQDLSTSEVTIATPVSGDLDGDDLPDIAAVVGNGLIRLLFGREDGTHEDGGLVQSYSPAIGLVAASLDGDDLIDLVALSAAGESPSALLPTGGGGFDLLILYSDVAGPGSVASDWDGDGDTDLLSPVPGKSQVRFAEGLGDGNFLQPTLLDAPFAVLSLVLGDANGDGALDVGLRGGNGLWQIALGTPTQVPLSNRMEIPDVSALPGETGVPFKVLGDHDVSLQGYTIVIATQPDEVRVDSISTSESDAETVGAELELANIDPLSGVTIFAVILDLMPPFDGQVLEPAAGHILATGTLSVMSTAPAGDSDLALTNGLGTPSTDNSFVSNGLTVLPDLFGGVVHVAAGAGNGSGGGGDQEDPGTGPPAGEEATFIRGDINSDGFADVSDGTMLQAWLNGIGAGPGCLDAADINDDGSVDLSDPVALYDFLFNGSNPPPAPYPAPGVDPTSDTLGCEVPQP